MQFLRCEFIDLLNKFEMNTKITKSHRNAEMRRMYTQLRIVVIQIDQFVVVETYQRYTLTGHFATISLSSSFSSHTTRAFRLGSEPFGIVEYFSSCLLPNQIRPHLLS